LSWHPNLWHPTTQVATSPEPWKVVRAQGCMLELDDGRHLIDAISSWWVTLHGHAEPAIAAAIGRQAHELEQVIFANFTHTPAEQLATRLAALTELERLFFSDNGSTAVEVALKIAWQWWRNQGSERRQLIAFEGAYHGDTFGAMAIGDRSIFTAPYNELLFDVARISWPHTHWGDASVDVHEAQALLQLEQALATPTAAVILEPLIQGAAGMHVVRPAFLRAVEDLVRSSGALLIADEVMTGFGRSGALFASQRAGIRPDLMALSKGLTGGFLPMGVTMATEDSSASNRNTPSSTATASPRIPSAVQLPWRAWICCSTTRSATSNLKRAIPPCSKSWCNARQPCSGLAASARWRLSSSMRARAAISIRSANNCSASASTMAFTYAP
jgi:adenosylmethionine-8-amino-7-oxononanoate aminotransferase